ncbi:MAG: glycosyltransferase family 2 protein [Bryobacteraceae bacterium]
MLRRALQIASIVGLILLTLGLMTAFYFDVYVSRLMVTDVFLRVSGVVVFGFLIAMLIRYWILLCLATLYQLENPPLEAELDHYPMVTMILPAHNEGPVIESSIRGAMNMDYPNFEVIVVDDGSTDDTFERARNMVPEYGGKLQAITQPNGGKSKALNNGISCARGEFVLCTDADSRLEPQTLKEAIKHFSDPEVCAVAGNVKIANRLNMLTRLQSLEYIEGLNLVRAAQAFLQKITVIPGPSGVFRKQVIIDIGGYLSDTFAEDCDLTLRLMLSGKRIKYESRCVAWTEAPEEVAALFKQRYRWGRGILQAILKHRKALWKPFPDPLGWLMLWNMLFESVAMVAMDFVGILLFLLMALGGGVSSLVFLWWLELTLLDVLAALFCLTQEKEDLHLVAYAVLYRLFFIPFVDAMRFFASLDELFNVRMGWFTQTRMGRI